MTDREKVIKGLECCIKLVNVGCKECPYDNSCFHGGRNGRLLKDALNLLKEYKRQDGCPCTHCMEWECDDVCDEYKKWANMQDGLEGE